MTIKFAVLWQIRSPGWGAAESMSHLTSHGPQFHDYAIDGTLRAYLKRRETARVLEGQFLFGLRFGVRDRGDRGARRSSGVTTLAAT